MVSFVSVAAVLAIVGGSLGYLAFPAGLSMGIKKAINLAENGVIYPKYMNPPFTASSRFHLFAVTNPREVLSGGRMSFATKGPYEFETSIVRYNISFERQGERVNFGTGRKLVPLPEKSADFDEKMWLVNPILPSTVRSVHTMVIDRVPFQRLASPVVFNAVNLLLNSYNERLLMRTTPREMLLGRKVELLESLSSLAARFGLSALVPPGPPQNIFGLASVQNATIDRVQIWTGTGAGESKFAEVIKWNDKSSLDMWRGSCSVINGTNCELFKPLLEVGEPIGVFLGPLCRSFFLEPLSEEPHLTKTGVRTYEYEISPRLFQGARTQPANKCYCENARTYDCQYDGLMAMGPCFFGAPLFFSRANLMNVDERIKRTIDHRSIADGPQLPEKMSLALEPITGTVLELNLTLMALFKVVRQPYMRDLANVRNLTYAPLFASTEELAMPFEYAWPIYALQTFSDYHKPIMAATALGGLGTLVFKFIFGVR